MEAHLEHLKAQLDLISNFKQERFFPFNPDITYCKGSDDQLYIKYGWRDKCIKLQFHHHAFKTLKQFVRMLNIPTIDCSSKEKLIESLNQHLISYNQLRFQIKQYIITETTKLEQRRLERERARANINVRSSEQEMKSDLILVQILLQQMQQIQDINDRIQNLKDNINSIKSNVKM